VKTVGQNADGAAGVPECDLGQPDEQIQEENADQDASDGLRA
jgi:hypothetical protein